MNSTCEKVALLTASYAFKFVLSAKIGVNIGGLIVLIYSYAKVMKTQKFAALHVNVRLALHLHAYYIGHVIVFMFTGNVIDLYRLSAHHADPCDYRLPFWLTYIVRQGYMFGVLGQTLTFVFLSVERIIATFRKGYEHNTSKTSFVLSALLNVVVCFGYAYVYMGYDADWSAQTEFFTQANERNGGRLSYFVYCMIACECFSILLYNVTYLLNSRGTIRIDSRDQHINKSLTEKYQIDENRRVVVLLLPVCWIHFGIYMLTYAGYFLFIKATYVYDTVLFECLIEGLGLIVLYAYIFSFRILRYFVWKRRVSMTTENTDEYFTQMNALFQFVASTR